MSKCILELFQILDLDEPSMNPKIWPVKAIHKERKRW
jgi:hypothetical protein